MFVLCVTKLVLYSWILRLVSTWNKGSNVCNAALIYTKIKLVISSIKNAPHVSKTIKIKYSNNLWYNNEIRNAKKALRKAEKKYLTQSKEHYPDEIGTEFRMLRQ